MVLGLFRRDRVFRQEEEINGYRVLKLSGEGRFGICYHIFRGQKQFILKQLKQRMLKKSKGKVRFEEEILKELKHEAIPQFIEKVELPGFCGYVLEFKEGRTFEDIISLDKHVFARSEIYSAGRQLIEIIKYLHSKGVVHRDIRIPNTLYDGQKVNLVDFGLARWINDRKYKEDIDFAFLGDFLLHLYYTSWECKGGKKGSWYEELELQEKELLFLKKLMGVNQRYYSIIDVESDFFEVFEDCR